jgi:hypothetical protein
MTGVPSAALDEFLNARPVLVVNRKAVSHEEGNLSARKNSGRTFAEGSSPFR